MQTISVGTHLQLFRGIQSGRRHAIVKFTSKGCLACRKMTREFAKMSEVPVDVYDVEYFDNKALGNFFSIKSVPTAILFEGGAQIYRVSGIKGVQEFMDITSGIAANELCIINWDA